MNYEAKATDRFGHPNIIRDAYEREFRRKEDTLKYYEQMKQEHLKRIAENEELETQTRKEDHQNSHNSVRKIF